MAINTQLIIHVIIISDTCLINLYYIIVFNSDIKKLNYKIWHAEL